MNEITLLRESGPEAPALRPEARSAARAALLAEIEGRPARRRRPSRRTALRTGIGVVTVAAAWTTAVLVAAPDGSTDTVTLVHFDTPTFPLSLDPPPSGTTPEFSSGADARDILVDYRAANGTDHVSLAVRDEEPEWLDDEHEQMDVTGTDEVTVDGAHAEVVRGRRDVPCEDGLSTCGTVAFADLVWERHDDQWVSLRGEGRYGHTADLLAIANALVDRPQPATLQVGLAPAGWSVQFFKMGRVLSLVNDTDEQQTLTVQVPLPEDVPPLDELRSSLMGPVGPLMTVSVQGRPAYLIRIDAGAVDKGWYLRAQFADGTTFVVQAPEAFTQEQVLAFAEQVTHHP